MIFDRPFTCKHCFCENLEIYHNVPKLSDRQVWANSVDPDQTAPDQGLLCLPFRLHLLDVLLNGKATLFEF